MFWGVARADDYRFCKFLSGQKIIILWFKLQFRPPDVGALHHALLAVEAPDDAEGEASAGVRHAQRSGPRAGLCLHHLRTRVLGGPRH